MVQVHSILIAFAEADTRDRDQGAARGTDSRCDVDETSIETDVAELACGATLSDVELDVCRTVRVGSDKVEHGSSGVNRDNILLHSINPKFSVGSVSRNEAGTGDRDLDLVARRVEARGNA